MQSWFLLVAAIVTEVGGTVCLKLSDGFSRLVPSLAVVVLYPVSFFFLATVLKVIDVSVAYAIWSGVGTALVAAIGILILGEPLSAARLLSLGFIIVGVVGLQLTGAVH
ncbi:MAG: multidrug efflux SMR transporter [Deltaproteobacteria bacterium]|nr:multidrug efflux SMR transporter [Deltaproteobacteria bacterium]